MICKVSNDWVFTLMGKGRSDVGIKKKRKVYVVYGTCQLAAEEEEFIPWANDR